ncbi:hypothetical protein K437DRAFT_97203 [Tilletiaria anomala UBC 951]|uniref:Uncharacterized protein n=1 Tax=Tilletiaria anomala (strain ATCC 24038 / CBS 436.72 / UBC 951) TaxID=1037660 RepID=A0A066WH07_TILAU|nr:uncharacterized protein K437DRAFT_97203 [Tilletiaria anomala UBC 951]KDN53277.1 hypothetical protein K437DRAFT_97203 [Tilletiaria anomala UBC 951]
MSERRQIPRAGSSSWGDQQQALPSRVLSDQGELSMSWWRRCIDKSHMPFSDRMRWMGLPNNRVCFVAPVASQSEDRITAALQPLPWDGSIALFRRISSPPDDWRAFFPTLASADPLQGMLPPMPPS